MKKITKVLLLLLCIQVSKQNANAQASPIDYATRIINCNYIFEGRVIKSTPYYNAASNYIYTSNTIEITKILKGDLKCGTVELITDDGKISNEIQFSFHTLHLASGVMGVFACNLTNKVLSAIDFYPENNIQKLEPTFEEQSFVQYFYNDSILKAYDLNTVIDSLQQIYDLTEILAGVVYIDCGNTEKVLYSKPTNNKLITNKAKITNTYKNINKDNTSSKIEFPKYNTNKATNDSVFAAMMVRANNARSHHRNEKSMKTLNYSFSNPVFSSGGGHSYFDFDINLADDVGGVYFSQGLIRFNYDVTTFGTYIVDSARIGTSRGTLISNAATYTAPNPHNISPNEIEINIDLGGTGSLASLPASPTQTVHVQMEVINCTGIGSISFTDQATMLAVALYDTTITGVASQPYDAVNANQTIFSPSCSTHINYITPNTVNGGVFQKIEIHGTHFGATQGNGNVYFKNADAGGLYEITTDTGDSVTWSDNLITMNIMSTDSGYDINNTWKPNQTIGTGVVKVITDSGNIAISPQPLDVYYSLVDVQFIGSIRKYRSNLVKVRTDTANVGYKFYVDSTIWNSPNYLGTVKRALRDWTCITKVNWEVVGTRNSHSLSSVKDSINMIQFGNLPMGIAARTKTYIYGCGANTKAFAGEMDVIISNSTSFITDTTGTLTKPAGQGDLYHSLLHELGHGHQINHKNDSTTIMYYMTNNAVAIPGPLRKIYLSNETSAGDAGINVMDTSAATTYSGTCYGATITYKVSNLCSSPNDVNEIKPTENELSIYPNPTSDILNINCNSSNQNEAIITISDIIGHTLKEKKIKMEKGVSLIQIDVSSLSNGLYICIVNSDTRKTTLKFIKQ